MAAHSTGGVQDWTKLREVAAQGYSDGIACLAAIETVERSNRPAVIDPLNRTEAGLAARLLRDSAFFRLHVMVVRAFAPVRHNDDLHLRAAINFLRKHVDNVQSDQERWHLEQAITLFGSAEADPHLQSLKHMRDKMLAHWAPDETVPLPKYRELFDFTRLTCEIWERLSFGAGTCTVELEHQIDAYRDSANIFWGRWED